MPFKLTCNVCGKNEAVGVAAMPGVPASFAYCRLCVNANAHPYPMIVNNTAMIGGLDDAADWWREMVECTLRHLGIERSKFDADVDEYMAELRSEGML